MRYLNLKERLALLELLQFKRTHASAQSFFKMIYLLLTDLISTDTDFDQTVSKS